MSVYRKLARSKRGMSTVFGGLFFVIVILMGFNLMLWGFIQYDSYNSVINKMSQRDQQAFSENLVPANPGGTDFTVNSFNITVNNLGSPVSISRIYITNISPTGSSQCSSSPCIVDPLPGSPYFTNGNVPAGVINHKIQVTGLVINDGSGYRVILASTKGRQSSFYYPWPVPLPPTSSLFQTNIGPLTVYFDFKSFNFTQGSQTQSQGAWVMPTNTYVVIWVKVANAATDSSIRLRVQSVLLFQPYGAGGLGSSTPFYIVDTATVNPNAITAYNENGASAYVLPAANPNGPTSFQIVKFGASAQGGNTHQKFPTSEGTFIVFIGFFYTYKGEFQGQTVPFVGTKTCTAWPAASCY